VETCYYLGSERLARIFTREPPHTGTAVEHKGTSYLVRSVTVSVVPERVCAVVRLVPLSPTQVLDNPPAI